jgi:Ca2+-binding EF-hand superfamily protein
MIALVRCIPGVTACGVLAVLAGCASTDSFAKLDANRDGSGSRAEFDAYMKQDVFSRVDVNHDAKVTKDEWQAVNPKLDEARFRKADRDGDRAITRMEADAAFDREGSLPKLFGKIDADGNGGLSRAEVNDFRSKVRQQPGATPVEKISKAANQP